jgi:hypothetical protein
MSSVVMTLTMDTSSMKSRGLSTCQDQDCFILSICRDPSNMNQVKSKLLSILEIFTLCNLSGKQSALSGWEYSLSGKAPA